MPAMFFWGDVFFFESSTWNTGPGRDVRSLFCFDCMTRRHPKIRFNRFPTVQTVLVISMGYNSFIDS